MRKTLKAQASAARRTARRRHDDVKVDDDQVVRDAILRDASEVRILEPLIARDFIRERQGRCVDGPDEVWEGVYVVPPLANNAHQRLVGAYTSILTEVVANAGQVQPGANVSDRRSGWSHSFRGPDVVVVLNGGIAEDCGTHWFGGPDFLVEVESPRDPIPEKLEFYAKIKVREVLVIHRETRQMTLYRHDGERLVPVPPTDRDGKKWLVSAVVPLAFRRRALKNGVQTDVQRTDGPSGSWTI